MSKIHTIQTIERWCECDLRKYTILDCSIDTHTSQCHVLVREKDISDLVDLPCFSGYDQRHGGVILTLNVQQEFVDEWRILLQKL